MSEYDHRKTKVGFTETADGEIHHLQHGCLQLPVKLRTEERTRSDGVTYNAVVHKIGFMRLPMPLYRNGRLAFALPGGGEVLA